MLLLLSGCSDLYNDNKTSLDASVYEAARAAGAESLKPGPPLDEAKVTLGQKLFFDKILSGNMDISCATCHHPDLMTGDALSLSIGVGGKGLGSARIPGEGRERIPRNAPEIFNRGAEEWHTMFWDNRVTGTALEGFETPAGDRLPDGLESVLAAQAMFPVTSRDEMLGKKGDKTIRGTPNEIARIPDGNMPAIWAALMRRTLAIPAYRDLFRKAYPGISENRFSFQHAANAIAAFEEEAFTLTESPWDRYLRGDEAALSDIAKKGALLFYGKARCSSCHTGTLMTDQKLHNICIPQLGPGKGGEAPLDLGRFIITGNGEDRFAFRTPPLRNVELTGPWMHNGAYTNLETAVRHHLNPGEAIAGYDVSQLEGALQATLQADEELENEMLASLDPLMANPIELTDKEMKELMAFLYSLTDPETENLGRYVPASVPSGLPVSD